MNDYEEIKLSRLKEFLGTQFNWNGYNVTLSDIEDYMNSNHPEIKTVFCDVNNMTPEIKNKEWHLGRIKYIINHPKEIDPIFVDNRVGDYGNIYAIPVIDDGHHRYLALTYLNQDMIKIYYCGRKDLLEYLKGDIDELPI